MIDIYAVSVPKIIDEKVYFDLLELVAQEKREKIEKCNLLHDKYRKLLVDILVRYIIGKKYNLSNNEISFSYNSFGKPKLVNPENYYINASHSGDWVVCISNANNEVGIDIEKIQPIDIKIAKRFFTHEEFNDIFIKNNMEQLHYFYCIWTLKESFLKLIGRGLSLPLNSFCIRRDHTGAFNILQSYINSSIYFKQYNIAPNYLISACATNNRFPKSIKIINFPTLCNYYKTIEKSGKL